MENGGDVNQCEAAGGNVVLLLDLFPRWTVTNGFSTANTKYLILKNKSKKPSPLFA